ncbi:three-Cys-motif partner protein TcmP [Hyphomicrobium sp. xq]|uniref:Three-Cys-motif partner protein TcmP n=1 Tax=Hyphomicrobium album TaxID=2665159 RepID=A0A6I3KHG6_9HYPH|nr:three-Cys-motif partner protein TcmP [Hyphomicrobium album]MTD93112.1 three-Cys-motif partner protein TcmP [Hyphomicrobium album]
MKGRGGPWTTKKLGKVREYLEAWLKVMSRQSWAKTVYIDAFSGSGEVILRDAAAPTAGSALQAVGLDPPMAEYHLIEKSEKALKRLREQIAARHLDRLDRVSFHAGDVNAILPALLERLTKKHRVVLFIDPYGMQLEWSTLQAIARCKAGVDLWLLVPTGMGLQRLATKTRSQMPASWGAKIDAFLGYKGWREKFYEPSRQTNFFGNEPEQVKVATLEMLDQEVQDRIRAAGFPGVARNVLHLKDKTRVLYSLMFACSNPSPAAQAASMNIANHLLRE